MAFPDKNIFEHTISEILKAASRNELSVDEDFIKFFLELTLLDPQQSKHLKKSFTEESLAELVDFCISKLSDIKNPAILAMKMQNHFEQNYDHPDKLITKNKMTIGKCTEPLLAEIIQARPETKDECEKLFRRISIYLVLKSGLGNPGNIQVLREGTSTLQSVFTMTDMKTFVQQRDSEKERQLEELLGIVSGIRIFNKDCGKGGESIPELTVNLIEAVEATSLALSHCLIRIMERVNLLTSAIDSYITLNPVTGLVKEDLPEHMNLTSDDFNIVCKILSVYRQYEVYVRKLINDMDRINIENKELILNFSAELYESHSLVRFRTAVPADQVFPHFVQMWMYWRRMQNEMFLVSTINSVMWNLDTAHEQLEAPHAIIDALLDNRPVISDAQRIQRTDDVKIDGTFSKCSIVFATGSTEDFKLQYLGFCAFCICRGALIPANPQMGMCLCNEKYYVHCSSEHAKIFCQNPDRYAREALEYVRHNIELIKFLQIYEDMYDIRNVVNLITKRDAIIITKEKEVQTELHPVPEHIDKDYSWNIWDYKRKACQLANIVNCKTHSTQTKYSTMRMEFGCQTDNMRDKNVQTTKDTGTTMPTIQTFLWGLRGQTEPMQHILTLTRPVEE